MRSKVAPNGVSIGSVIFSILFIALMAYFTFAALRGEYGLFRLFQVEAVESRLRNELVRLQTERIGIASKGRMLSGELLEFDLLDEQARSRLGLGRPDEIIIRSVPIAAQDD